MLTEEQIVELKAKHGDKLAAVQCSAGDVVFKPAIRAAYDKWRDKHFAEPLTQSDNARELCQGCLVSPTWAEFKALLDTMPALLMKCTDAIGELAGLSEQYSVKKL